MSEATANTAPGQPRAGLSTRCVHAGDTRDPQGAIHPPLYGHSTFAFDSTADLLDVVDGRTEGNLYTRYGLNPTIRALERKLADLEDADAALAFGSGMAAELPKRTLPSPSARTCSTKSPSNSAAGRRDC